MKWIWLDMDGTIADFYNEKDWLVDLMAHNTKPYEKAKPMYDNEILDVLLQFKVKGYNIGIISWSSKEKNRMFDKKVEQAKNIWLRQNNFDLILDKVIVTQYGINKADTCKEYGYGILIDDEKPNRDSWYLGPTVNANENIIKTLRIMLDKI